jgi:iron complex outermembrane receptor protein
MPEKRRGPRLARRLLVLFGLLLIPHTPAPARAREAGAAQDLTGLSVEELMQIEVTSVSKRAQRLTRAPAAIQVLSAEDIRRAGVTSIPEALRMVPGLHVAQIDASRWAITARAFNNQFANKLLVLIDGRTAYTPLFSGVFWDVQDVVLEDIERIEVIRGPGGTLWGANAVNGVINIITKSARDTKGVLATAGGGSLEQGFGTLRTGGTVGESTHWRAYGKGFNRGEFDRVGGGEAHDAWWSARGGLRVDWDATQSDLLTLQGDYYDGDADETLVGGILSDQSLSGGNLLGRWTRELGEDHEVSLQTYYDRTERGDLIVSEKRNTLDAELRHRFQPLARNDVVWGAGYRATWDSIESSPGVGIAPASRTFQLLNAFLQDEIGLVEDTLWLTLGTKLEYNTYTGIEVQPSARALWAPHERHSLWAAVSRAIRGPSRIDNDASALIPGPTPTTLVLFQGDRDFDSENLLAVELGYRATPLEALAVDLAGFYDHYTDLRTVEPGTPFPIPCPPAPFGTCSAIPSTADNNAEADAWGAEASATWRATARWRLTLGYTWIHVHVDTEAKSLDATAVRTEDDVPTHQVHLLSRIDLPFDLEFDTSLYWVDDVPSQRVSDYFRLDQRLAWSPLEGLELSVSGLNLTDRRHSEFGDSPTTVHSAVPRSVFGRVTWRR